MKVSSSLEQLIFLSYHTGIHKEHQLNNTLNRNTSLGARDKGLQGVHKCSNGGVGQSVLVHDVCTACNSAPTKETGTFILLYW